MAKKSKQNTSVEQLEKQIALLMTELSRLRQESDSLWYTIFNLFMEEENEEETAEYFANKFSSVLSGWAKKKRDSLAVSVASSGVMPPYSECLNDLVVAISPPGSKPPVLGEVPIPDKEDILQVSLSRDPATLSVPDPSEGISDDAKVGPPKMKRVNVPRAIPGAVPIGLIEGP